MGFFTVTTKVILYPVIVAVILYVAWSAYPQISRLLLFHGSNLIIRLGNSFVKHQMTIFLQILFSMSPLIASVCIAFYQEFNVHSRDFKWPWNLKKKMIAAWIRIVLDAVSVLDYWCYDIFIHLLIQVFLAYSIYLSYSL